VMMTMMMTMMLTLIRCLDEARLEVVD
jgi:hypothetical protein